MNRRGETSVASTLEAGPDEVWERIITAEGINDEMLPVMRMTLPPGVESLDPDRIETGVKLGRSWILLFGLLPFDYDDIGITWIERPNGFVEESEMLSQRYWRHERTLDAVGGGGTLITDRLAWEPRPPVPGRVLEPLIGAFFRHRHARLRRRFGGSPAR